MTVSAAKLSYPVVPMRKRTGWEMLEVDHGKLASSKAMSLLSEIVVAMVVVEVVVCEGVFVLWLGIGFSSTRSVVPVGP